MAEQPLKDIIVVMRDTGMRNARELYRMRIENIDWNKRVIFNPSSKTKKLAREAINARNGPGRLTARFGAGRKRLKP